MKKNSTQPRRTERTAIPIMQKDKDGNAILICPFCSIPHPLLPGVPAMCGTILSLTATQVVYRAKYEKHMICVKCGKGGDHMVLFQNGFIHTHDCAPGVVAMTEPPQYSKLAKYVYGLKPGRYRKSIERFTGKAMIVEEIMPDGKKTGVILGHFFPKRINENGKHSTTRAGK